MKCPYCQSFESKVIDSRESSEYNIRRRRECLSCEERFTTYETVSDLGLKVIKRNGSIEPFNREKLMRGIVLACKKRPITLEMIGKIVDEIENHIKDLEKGVIESAVIGDIILSRLKAVDKIAYLRFASVYHNFANIEAFETALENLKIIEGGTK